MFKNINLSDNLKIAVIFMLISISENIKTKLGKEIHLRDFIIAAIEIINNYEPEKYSYEKQIKIEYIYHILNEIKNKIYIKHLISKDATASVYQHLVKALGYATPFAFKICNLNSTNTWYDTYEFIIEEFKKRTNPGSLNLDDYNLHFNRITLKKTIMTKLYSCGEKKCWNYFLKILEDNALNYYNYNEKKKMK